VRGEREERSGPARGDGPEGKQVDREKMGHGENLGRRKREGEKEVGRGVLGQKGGGEGFGVLFFSNLFKLKHFQNSFQNFSNHFKTFKTPHHHT
jgi:hypothetical protein